jgi:hypothetical protein
MPVAARPPDEKDIVLTLLSLLELLELLVTTEEKAFVEMLSSCTSN